MERVKVEIEMTVGDETSVRDMLLELRTKAQEWGVVTSTQLFESRMRPQAYEWSRIVSIG